METHNLDLSIPGAIDALLARHKAMYGDAVMMADDGSEAGDSDLAATASSDKPDDDAPDQQDEPLGEPGNAPSTPSVGSEPTRRRHAGPRRTGLTPRRLSSKISVARR